MRKAFTMIELIVVMVILAILAAVATPRLLASRDDAEIVKTLRNLITMQNDIIAYYAKNADISDTLTKMTNVKISNANTAKTGETRTGDILSAGKACLSVSLTPITNTAKPATFLVEKGSDSDEGLCVKIYANSDIKDILDATYSYFDNQGKEITNQKGVPISGN